MIFWLGFLFWAGERTKWRGVTAHACPASERRLGAWTANKQPTSLLRLEMRPRRLKLRETQRTIARRPAVSQRSWHSSCGSSEVAFRIMGRGVPGGAAYWPLSIGPLFQLKGRGRRSTGVVSDALHLLWPLRDGRTDERHLHQMRREIT